MQTSFLNERFVLGLRMSCLLPMPEEKHWASVEVGDKWTSPDREDGLNQGSRCGRSGNRKERTDLREICLKPCFLVDEKLSRGNDVKVSHPLYETTVDGDLKL